MRLFHLGVILVLAVAGLRAQSGLSFNVQILENNPNATHCVTVDLSHVKGAVPEWFVIGPTGIILSNATGKSTVDVNILGSNPVLRLVVRSDRGEYSVLQERTLSSHESTLEKLAESSGPILLGSFFTLAGLWFQTWLTQRSHRLSVETKLLWKIRRAAAGLSHELSAGTSDLEKSRVALQELLLGVNIRSIRQPANALSVFLDSGQATTSRLDDIKSKLKDLQNAAEKELSKSEPIDSPSNQ